MSAWIVSFKHVNTLVAYARVHHLTYVWQDKPVQVELDPARIAKMLYKACVDSVNYRYDEDTTSEDFVYAALAESGLPGRMSMIKQVGCYNYQSCERPDYEQSEAKAFVNALTLMLREQLGLRDGQEPYGHPQYERAPWGLD